MLYSIYKKLSINQVINIATFLLFVWILTPIVIMMLNFLSDNTEMIYSVWVTIFYFVGFFSYIIFPVFFASIWSKKLTKTEKVVAILPLISILVFGVWSFVCAEFSTFKFASFMGIAAIQDSVTSYFFYGGFILLGFMCSANSKRILFLVKALLLVATIMMIPSIINNSFSNLLFVNGFTNCFEYQGVFYNTNHTGYYLTIVIVLSACLYIIERELKARIFYLIIFSTQLYFLILNNTMGSYLAVMLTLIFINIWKVLNKESNKKNAAIILLTFVVVSALSLFGSDNIVDNFIDTFYGLVSLTTNGRVGPQKIEDIGSGRGALWKFALYIAAQHPFLGVGPQNITIFAHNMFLQIAMYTGFVGLGLYMMIYIIGVIRLYKSKNVLTKTQKIASFTIIAYVISGFFGVTMFYTAPYFYAILGVALSGTLNEMSIREENIWNKLKEQ